ncbi:MAG TPA: hypothetical protein PK400_11285 [Phycisphaerales bacterium]|nr:hypothetical protein [Phycisphaerales bacterium]HRQ75753.1 hypothetical protein [Phycisphaerales bacterium]
MIRITRISTFAQEGAGRAGAAWRTVASQPSWITRIALMAFLIIVGLPILLLLLFALLVATIVFVILALINAVLVRLRGAMPRNDGRENVRVIRRAE